MSNNQRKCSLCLGSTMVSKTGGGLRKCPVCSDRKISVQPDIQPIVEPIVKAETIDDIKEEAIPDKVIEVVKFRKKTKRRSPVKKK